jgi:serine/threonine protein kinase/Tol biopolymer transport system component
MAGRYRILDRVGSGGIGVVYRAEDLELRRHVALKVLPEHSFASPQARSRFLREARLAARLNHPSVCTIHEVGEFAAEERLESGEAVAAGTPYIAMELIRGKTLHALLAERGPQTLDEALRVGMHMAEGLAEAHRHGIVHRDLKPQNVMITEEGRIKILDFGLAKPLDPIDHEDLVMRDAEHASAELTASGMVIGTVPYMSPEQLQGRPVDARSDIFSFGIVLYETVTGRKPWRGTGPASTVAGILEAEPEPLDLAGAPEELERILRRCLRKKPDERYNDTRDLVVALKDLREETSTTTTRVAAARRRSWRRWVAAASGAIALGAVVVVAVLPGRPPVPRATEAPPAAHRQVTFTGKATLPDLSPDGTYAAYVEGDAGALMVQDLSGGDPLRLCDAHRPQWSPDGSRIAFFAYSGSTWGVHLVPRLGGTPQILAGKGSMLAWSPDGARLAISGPPDREIRLLDTRSGTATAPIPLTGTFVFLKDLAWSPRGNLLVARTSDETEEALWIVPVDGGAQFETLKEAFEIMSPRWSPGGDAIYYLARKGETTDLWKLPVDPLTGKRTGQPVAVLAGLPAGGVFSLSGDGRRLLCTRESGRANLWVVTLAEGGGVLEAERLTTGTVADRWPSVSPDGLSVAFTRGRWPKASLFVMPLEGGPPRQLTFGETVSLSPAWAPDGRMIAFGTYEEGIPRVATIPLSGGAPRVYEETSLSMESPTVTWAPSVSILYQLPLHQNFHVLDPKSGRESPLVANPEVGWMFSPCWSPQGDRLVVNWNRPADGRGLWLIEPGSGSQTYLGVSGHPLGWSPDGAWIYAVRTRERAGSLFRIPAVGGEVQEWGTLPFTAPASDASVTPDGMRLVISVNEGESDVWVVDNFDPAAGGR